MKCSIGFVSYRSRSKNLPVKGNVPCSRKTIQCHFELKVDAQKISLEHIFLWKLTLMEHAPMCHNLFASSTGIHMILINLLWHLANRALCRERESLETHVKENTYSFPQSNIAPQILLAGRLGAMFASKRNWLDDFVWGSVVSVLPCLVVGARPPVISMPLLVQRTCLWVPKQVIRSWFQIWQTVETYHISDIKLRRCHNLRSSFDLWCFTDKKNIRKHQQEKQHVLKTPKSVILLMVQKSGFKNPPGMVLKP